MHPYNFLSLKVFKFVHLKTGPARIQCCFLFKLYNLRMISNVGFIYNLNTAYYINRHSEKSSLF